MEKLSTETTSASKLPIPLLLPSFELDFYFCYKGLLAFGTVLQVSIGHLSPVLKQKMPSSNKKSTFLLPL